MVDSTPAAGRTGAGADRLLLALMDMPRRWASRRSAVERIQRSGFDVMIAEWVATNLHRVGEVYEWRFDLTSLELLLADFYRADLWSVVRSPPAGVDIWFLRASRDSILGDDAAARISRLASAGSSARLIEVDGGHWLNMSNPAAVLRLLRSELPR